MAKLFDPKCLELARYFYPDYPEPILTLLAEEIQTVCEDFSGGLKYDLAQILAEKKAERAAQETPAARPCVWRTGCKNPSVCDKQGVCVPGGEATDCTCKDYPGADEFCTAHKSQPCGAPLDADGVDKCERQKGHTGVCGLDPV